MKSVRFLDFWEGFEPSESLFVQILQEELGTVSLEHRRNSLVDFQFHSVFLNRNEQLARKISTLLKRNTVYESSLLNVAQNYKNDFRRKVNRKIWFTGENVRPPLQAEFDGYLSFDQDNYDGKNAYLPLWWLRLNWFEDTKIFTQLGVPIDKRVLLQPREIAHKKSKFACAFIGNPHPKRIHFIEKLSKLGIVDIYGSYVGRPVLNKYDVAKDYKFSICFENDLYPGYVTEKLIDAYVTGNVPIYWGNLGDDKVINRSSFVNLQDFQSVNDCISYLSQMDYESVYSKNFLTALPVLSEVNRVIFGAPQENSESL